MDRTRVQRVDLGPVLGEGLLESRQVVFRRDRPIVGKAVGERSIDEEGFSAASVTRPA
jgi:hypothetical protein